ncbi:hypothetical protein LCGC14_1720630 [marine sediment metagenome]|uniref:Uncharacterized protein n=1 Tax=marine sediment metagenome TaxID=412755 RepID=A0A0F9JT12_9ZZZZ
MAVINYTGRTYAEMQTLISQMLQDTGNSTYDTTELGYWIEEAGKEFSTYKPHIVPITFQVESRFGSDSAGTASKLTDTAKSQFVAGDATFEKVIHNMIHDTWAVVEAQDSTSVLSISADIMNSGDNYEIYNTRCWNKRQIYIGDVTDSLWVDSVEYPIGQKRNWEIYNDVLEIGVDFVADSDSTLSTLERIDVLVRFNKPHRLNQLTDWSGEANATGAKGDTTLAIDGMGATEIIERGDEFYFQYHRALYTITKDVTTSANAATITFFPPLEAAVTDNDDIEFTKSTLNPQDEEVFAQLVAARTVLSDSIRHIGGISVAGAGTWLDYQTWARDKLSEVLSKLNKNKMNSKKMYSRGTHGVFAFR